MYEILPLLIEIKDAGWEVLTGARGPEELIISRFGKKIKYFTFSNSKRDKIKGRVEIKGKYFENFAPLLTDWFGNKYIFEIKGRDTFFNIEILPREFVVFKSICGYNGDGIKIRTKKIKRADSIEILIDFLVVKGKT